MKSFVIAFPLPFSLQEAPEFLQSKLNLDTSKERVMVAGSSIFYKPILQNAVADLAAIFAEHSPLSSEESAEIAAHKSLLFLEFSVQSADEFESFLTFAKKILEDGALGVYSENSGAAWSAKTFTEIVNGDVPLEAFVNFVETADSMFTLGLEPFAAPDFCISLKDEKLDHRAILISAADAVVFDGQDAASGAKWKNENNQIFEFKNELTPPFKKGSAEWNAEGYRRLIAKKSAAK